MVDSLRPVYEAPPWAPEKTIEWLETCFNVQSMQFMIDCLPTIQQLLTVFPRSRPLRVLDVGTGSGAGANILATLYAGDFLGHRMTVDAMELVHDLEGYAKSKFPLINYRVVDVMTVQPEENSWDIIICSHTIEHIDEAISFVKHLQTLAKEWVLFYAPWKEEHRIEGHVTRIDEAFLKEVGPFMTLITESFAWSHPVDAQAKCVLFVVTGTGGARR